MHFLGSRRMETAPTSIEALLRPILGQADEPSDLRGSLSNVAARVSWCIQHLIVQGCHPSNYGPGPALLNFSDRADTDD